jgi:hypothetical protein
MVLGSLPGREHGEGGCPSSWSERVVNDQEMRAAIERNDVIGPAR